MKDKEYDLKQSAKGIGGYIYPALIAKGGQILDGVHRLKEDDKWPKIKLEHIDTRKKRLIVRLVANFQRRRMLPKELRFTLNSLAEEYRSEGVEGTLTETIAKETGVNVRTVSKYLKDEYKDLSHAVRKPDLKSSIFKSDKQPKSDFLLSADWDCPVCNKHVAVYCDGQKHKFDNR